MKTHLLFFFLSLSIAGFSQSPYKAYLEDAKSKPEVLMLEQQIQYLNQKYYKLAPIQKLEFRTESNQLDPGRQEYALRINPANPWEMSAQNKYFTRLTEQLQLEKEIVLEESLMERYLIVVDFAFTQSLLIQKQKELNLTKQWINVLDKQTYSDYFDADKYFDLMIKEIELQDECEDLENKLQELNKIKTESEEFPTTISAQDFKSIFLIDSLMDDAIAPTSKIARLKELKKNALNSSIKLEKSNINVGYLQAQYQEFRIEQGRKPWNIGFGVTLPLFNPNKKNTTKRNLDLIESNLESDQDLLQQKTEANQLYISLKSLIKRVKKLDENINKMKSDKINNLIVASSDSNPTVSLKINLQIEKLKSIRIKLEQKIWEDYITWLKTTNQLLTTSPQNVLIQDIELLSLDVN